MSASDEHEGEVPYPASERIFLLLSGVFLTAMVCMNVLGITRFVEIGGYTVSILGAEIPLFHLAIGVLPYPVTFLCTDIISELYGKRRASFVVWTGFGLNVFLLAVCWLGNILPAPFDSHREFYQRAWQEMGGVGGAQLPAPEAFYGQIWSLMSGATMASMVAYLAAQLCDVHLFHFWKRVTRGKHLWLRNNASTMVSQLVDTVAVLTITFWGELAAGHRTVGWLAGLILGSYAFKFVAALLDTPFFYLACIYLKPHVQAGAEPVPVPVPAD